MSTLLVIARTVVGTGLAAVGVCLIVPIRIAIRIAIRTPDERQLWTGAGIMVLGLLWLTGPRLYRLLT